MNFFNLGIGEILFILVIALIIFGPGSLVKTARDMGAFVRKVTKSPYWQEVWATKRELTELPKIISKEAHLDETISELDKETKGIKSRLSSSVSDFIKEVNQPGTPSETSKKPDVISGDSVDVSSVEPEVEEVKEESQPVEKSEEKEE
jgi:Sec-independent protein translocase protein TatA